MKIYLLNAIIQYKCVDVKSCSQKKRRKRTLIFCRVPITFFFFEIRNLKFQKLYACDMSTQFLYE